MEIQIHHLEQEAYSSVLRAFLAQSDSISWDQLELITHLRRELRVSDDEHKELYGRVKDDDIIQRIKEWRQGGGNQATTRSSSQPVCDPLPMPSVTGSYKKQKTFHSGPSPSSGMLSLGFQGQSYSSAKQGTRGKKLKPGQTFPGLSSSKSLQYPATGPMARGRFKNRSSSGAPLLYEDVASSDPLVGRKVFTRWPEDNNFYEAVITDYNPLEGRHALVYDINTVHASWEWVDLKEISPEDVQWVGEDPGISLREGSNYRGCGYRKSMSHGGGGIPAARMGKVSTNFQPRIEFPSQNGTRKVVSGEIEITNTETLIKEVEKIFSVNNPNPCEIDKAKRMLKEHEEALVDAINRLAEASDGESGDEPPLSHCHSVGRADSRDIQDGGNQQHCDSFEEEIAVDGYPRGEDGIASLVQQNGDSIDIT